MNSISSRRTAFAIVLTSCAFAMGCSSNSGGTGTAMEPQEALLREASDLLRTGRGSGGKLSDLASYEAHFPNAYAAIKKGDIVVLRGTTMLGEGDVGKGVGTLVAHEKAASTSGGWVLFTDGKLKKIAAGEFASLPKGSK